MRIAFSTNAFTSGKHTVEQALKIIALHGFEGVEVLADHPLVWVPTITKKQVRSIRKTIEKLHLGVSSVNAFTAEGYFLGQPILPHQNFGPSWTDPDVEDRECRVWYTKKCIDFCQDIGGACISVGPGQVPPGISQAQAWKWLVEGLRESVRYAEKKKISVNLEYEPQLTVRNVGMQEKILKELDSDWFNSNFDFGHSFCCLEDPCKAFQRIHRLGRIGGLHIEDIKRGSDSKPVHYHLVPGTADMPLREILATLKKEDYQGWLTVELYTFAKRPVYAVKETAKWFRRQGFLK